MAVQEQKHLPYATIRYDKKRCDCSPQESKFQVKKVIRKDNKMIEINQSTNQSINQTTSGKSWVEKSNREGGGEEKTSCIQSAVTQVVVTAVIIGKELRADCSSYRVAENSKGENGSDHQNNGIEQEPLRTQRVGLMKKIPKSNWESKKYLYAIAIEQVERICTQQQLVPAQLPND